MAPVHITMISGLNYKKDSYFLDHQIIQADDYPHFDLSKFFQAGIDFIERNRKQTNILVHCHAGISRSSTMVIAYLMKSRNWRCQKTLLEVRKRRAIICPNPGFMRQLLNFQKKLLAKGDFNQYNSNPPPKISEPNKNNIPNDKEKETLKKKQQLIAEFKNFNLTGNNILEKKKKEPQNNIETPQQQAPKNPVSKDKKIHNYHYERNNLQKKFNLTDNAKNDKQQKGINFGKLLNVYKGFSSNGLNKRI